MQATAPSNIPLNGELKGYGEDYFLRGEEKGLSLYTNYRWLPDLTIPMAKAIASHLGIKPGATILDFGCARGYLVRAFRELGYSAFGFDTSRWAIDNCDPSVSRFVTDDDREVAEYDWVIAKDVLEHVEEIGLSALLCKLLGIVNCGMFIVVPLSEEEDKPYVVPQYEMDVTHRVRLPLNLWEEYVRCAADPNWDIRAVYRVPGVKDNYYEEFPKGNGFITALR